MRSHRRIRNLTAKPRAQACKPHRFKSFNTDGSLSQATACSNHGHLDLESRARLFAARAATAAQSQPEHRECNPQGRLSCSSQYSIYLDISRYACQGSRRSGHGAVGRLVLLPAAASCTAPSKSNKKSVPARQATPRATPSQRTAMSQPSPRTMNRGQLQEKSPPSLLSDFAGL